MTSNLVDINSETEWNQALRSAKAEGRTIVVDFWAVWCGPCKIISPVFTKLAGSFPQVNFLRVDVDAQQSIAKKYKITAMPTFLAIKSGEVVDMIRGAIPRALQDLVTKHAGPNPPVPTLPEKAEEDRRAGNEHFKKGEFNEAVDKYSTAISMAPTSAPLFANRSISYLKSTPPNTTAAVEDARHATELDPKWGKGWVRLGDALLADGAQIEDVKATYEKALELMEEGQMKNEILERLQSLNVSTT